LVKEKVQLGVFILSVAGTFVAFLVLTGLYIWPALRKLPKYEALKILALPHAFRFVGLSFLFPGVVSPELTSAFSIPAAWGDFGAAMLALLSIAALVWRWSFAIPLVWIFNLWGTIDLLYAFYNAAILLEIEPRLFGAAFYIPTMIVPPLLVIHALIFLILLRTEKASVA
jgi:hypothetical protein